MLKGLVLRERIELAVSRPTYMIFNDNLRPPTRLMYQPSVSNARYEWP